VIMNKLQDARCRVARVKLDLYCHKCGCVVRALVSPDTRDVICPKCKSTDVYSYPNKKYYRQIAHYKRLMRAIVLSIKRQNRKMHHEGRLKAGYTYKNDWLIEIYNE